MMKRVKKFWKRSRISKGNLTLPNVETCYKSLIIWKTQTLKYIRIKHLINKAFQIMKRGRFAWQIVLEKKNLSYIKKRESSKTIPSWWKLNTRKKLTIHYIIKKNTF